MLQHVVGGSVKALRIGGHECGGERFIRHLDGEVRDVGGDLDVHRALLAQARMQGAVKLLDHVHRGNARGNFRKRCDGVEHVGKVAVGKRVVQVPPELRGVLRRRAGEGHQRDVLGARSRNAVEGGELAHAVGGEQAAHALLAGIAICRIRRVELIAGADEADAVSSLNLFKEA